MPDPLETRIAQVLAEHHLGGDTAQINDAAGLCACGKRFYVYGGEGETADYLAACQRVLAAHNAHVAAEIARALGAETHESRRRLA